MKKESNINIRIDKEMKEEVESLFESMGLNVSTAVNLFFKQCLIESKIPFEIKADIKMNKKKKIKINKEIINCIENNGICYFEYNKNKFALIKEKVYADELCIYPKEWKVEHKGVFPSPIHYETSKINSYISKGFEKLNELENNYTKILVLDEIKRLSIHVNGGKKEILLPENTVNDIHIIINRELDNYMKYCNDYKDIIKYSINY